MPTNCDDEQGRNEAHKDASEDITIFETTPMMLMDSILSNATFGGLNADEIYESSQLALDREDEEEDGEDLPATKEGMWDDMFKFEAAVDAGIWFKQTVARYNEEREAASVDRGALEKDFEE